MQLDLNALIMKHSGLVYRQLHKLHLVDDPEAESIGYEALYNAIKDYDEKRGNKLSTVATVYIYNALGSYIRSLNKQRQLTVISYNSLMQLEDGGGHEYIDIIASTSDIEKECIDKEVQRIAIDTFNDMYAKLTNEKHKAILHIWRESEFTMQTTDIAKRVGVSQSYVSQVINNFKFNLRKKLEDVYYD